MGRDTCQVVGADTVVETLRPHSRAGAGHASRARLAKESVLSLGGSVFAGTLSLIIPVIVTRQLSAADAGIYFEAVALFMVLLSAGALGSDTGVLRSLPAALVRGESAAVPLYLRTAVWLPVIWAGLVSLALVIAAPQLAVLLLHASPEHESTLVTCIYIVAGGLPFGVAYLVTMAATRGLHSIRMLVLVDKLGKSAVQLLVVAGAVLIAESARGAVVGWLSAYVMGLMVTTIWLVSYIRRNKQADSTELSSSERRTLVRAFWKFSIPRAGAHLCNVAMQRVDILLVGALLGPADAALYAAATRFVVLGSLLAQSIQQVMAPKISAAVAADKQDDAREVYQTTTAWLTLIAWPMYLVAVSFAALLLSVFGDGYRTAWPAVVILCFTMLIATACGPVDTVLLMAGRSLLSLQNAFIALVAMVIADLVLIPSLGIEGAAIGWATALATKNLLALVQVHGVMSMHPFGRAFRTAAVITVTSYGIIPFITVQVMGESVAALGVSLLLGVITSAFFVARKLSVLGLDSARRLWPSRSN